MVVKDIFSNIHQSLTEAQTPFDLAVDFLNGWADFTGLEIIKTRKVKSLDIQWVTIAGTTRMLLNFTKLYNGVFRRTES